MHLPSSGKNRLFWLLKDIAPRVRPYAGAVALIAALALSEPVASALTAPEHIKIVSAHDEALAEANRLNTVLGDPSAHKRTDALKLNGNLFITLPDGSTPFTINDPLLARAPTTTQALLHSTVIEQTTNTDGTVEFSVVDLNGATVVLTRDAPGPLTSQVTLVDMPVKGGPGIDDYVAVDRNSQQTIPGGWYPGHI